MNTNTAWQDSEYYDGEEFCETGEANGKLTDISFNDCTFSKCLFSGYKLLGCRFENCRFTGCDFNAAKLPDCRFSQCEFIECRLSGIDWTLAEWPLQPLPGIVSFESCQLSHASFFGLKLPGIRLTNSTAISADFTGTDLSGCELCGTDFDRANFNETNLSKADLCGAINYYIDIANNRIKKAKFSHPEVMNLLSGLDIVIK